MSATTRDRSPFLVIGIGASAGGLEALKLFFADVGNASGLAFVVILHGGREQAHDFSAILQRFVSLPVVAGDDGTLVEPGHIYVPPRGAAVTISRGSLVLHADGSELSRAKTIDVFFSSLAEDRGENAAAVVLSGLDGDGTLGIKAIKERNGLTLAQIGDEDALKFDSMPQSAIATGLVDLALPAGEMVQRLVAFARGIGALGGERGSGSPRIDVGDVLPHKPAICAVLAERTGHDFGGYKDQTFARRVQRRCVFLEVADVADYVSVLRSHPAEATALFRDLLINVTDFFRDAEAFHSLQEDVLPELFAGRTAKDTVRVWVPGCATGEEVFSIAILMKEATTGIGDAPRVQIFATDIDERALDVARAGRYPEQMLKGVSEERRRRFFTRDGGSFVLNRDVRELCIFSSHSVFRDPPFSRVDLVSCRNLLIYLGADVQHQVLPIFHYSLRGQGFLFLGLAESVGQYSDLFDPIDRKNRIFRARDVDRPMPQLPFALDRNPGFPRVAPRPPGASRIRRAAESQIVERHGPQFVVVDLAGNVVHYSSNTGFYLQPSPGSPSRDLVDLMRKGARLDLRGALREAAEMKGPVQRTGLRVDDGHGSTRSFTLSVEPLDKRDDGEPLLVVVFRAIDPDDRPGTSGGDVGPAAEARDDFAEFQNESRQMRERLQATVEEYETTMEELRSSNEELVALNEEHQSSNEELEASREEMQSLNEELQTVNAELKSNIADLDATNEDLRNFFESTETATVFLDNALSIRNFTPPALDLFRMKPSDKGRSLIDLSTTIDYPDMERDLRSCLADGVPLNRVVSARQGEASYALRIRPFEKLRSGDAGLVITATDISRLRQLEAQLAASK